MMMDGPLLARFFWTNLLCDLFLPFDISSVKTRLDFVQSPFPACFVCGFFFFFCMFMCMCYYLFTDFSLTYNFFFLTFFSWDPSFSFSRVFLRMARSSSDSPPSSPSSRIAYFFFVSSPGLSTCTSY